MEEIGQVKSWLPESVIVERLPVASFAALIDDWSSQWFAAAQPRAGSWAKATPEKLAPEILTTEEGLALACSASVTERLADLIFGTPADVRLTVADRRHLNQVVDACIDDLKHRLQHLFGVPAGAVWKKPDMTAFFPGSYCSIHLGGSERHASVAVLVADDLVVRLVRAGLPPCAAQGGLQPLSEALITQPVSLSARLGSCRVPLADLANCVVGDVLVLDQGLEDSVELVVGRDVHPDLACRIIERDQALHLVLS